MASIYQRITPAQLIPATGVKTVAQWMQQGQLVRILADMHGVARPCLHSSLTIAGYLWVDAVAGKYGQANF
jgi:hypothetical protein